MDLIDILKKIEQKEGFQSGHAQDEEQIMFFESELNVKFPNSYKMIFKRYGYMAWDEGEIYGASTDVYYNLLEKNKFARQQKLPENFLVLPIDAFVFDKYSGGGYYMLFSADSPRAGQVGLFLSESGYHEEQTWESLEAFLEDYYCS